MLMLTFRLALAFIWLSTPSPYFSVLETWQDAARKAHSMDSSWPLITALQPEPVAYQPDMQSQIILVVMLAD
ncbi:hypothetical protein F5146DRAFT_1228943 [Armillaria mellea]|nr:hypothetical protein F5146DRAFT_1228943 [Armillaria mellea]